MEYCLQRLRDADIPKDTFVNISRLSSFAAAGSWLVHVFEAQMHRFEMNGFE